MIAGIEITPDGKTAYAFAVPHSTNETVNGYIVKSTDDGKTWVRTDGQIMAAQFISKFAFGNNGIVYAALIQNSEKTGVASSLYSSNDDGKTWLLEGTNNKKLVEI
jgi:photosystem II stability/assembly factor-like uncharacterized protein